MESRFPLGGFWLDQARQSSPTSQDRSWLSHDTPCLPRGPGRVGNTSSTAPRPPRIYPGFSTSQSSTARRSRGLVLIKTYLTKLVHLGLLSLRHSSSKFAPNRTLLSSKLNWIIYTMYFKYAQGRLSSRLTYRLMSTSCALVS